MHAFRRARSYAVGGGFRTSCWLRLGGLPRPKAKSHPEGWLIAFESWLPDLGSNQGPAD